MQLYTLEDFLHRLTHALQVLLLASPVQCNTVYIVIQYANSFADFPESALQNSQFLLSNPIKAGGSESMYSLWGGRPTPPLKKRP